MKKVDFLNRECVYFKGISYTLNNRLDIFENTGKNLEFARQKEDGSFLLLTEDDISMECLDRGEGVFYKGYFVFKADLLEQNKHFNQFKELYSQIEKEYKSYQNGILYSNLKDKSAFSMVKSFITLFETGVVSMEWLHLKLDTYLKPEGVGIVLNQLNVSVELAG